MCYGGRQERMNSSLSASIVDASVIGMPCEKPGFTLRVPLGRSLDESLDESSMGTTWPPIPGRSCGPSRPAAHARPVRPPPGRCPRCGRPVAGRCARRSRSVASSTNSWLSAAAQVAPIPAAVIAWARGSTTFPMARRPDGPETGAADAPDRAGAQGALLVPRAPRQLRRRWERHVNERRLRHRAGALLQMVCFRMPFGRRASRSRWSPVPLGRAPAATGDMPAGGPRRRWPCPHWSPTRP